MCALLLKSNDLILSEKDEGIQQRDEYLMEIIQKFLSIDNGEDYEYHFNPKYYYFLYLIKISIEKSLFGRKCQVANDLPIIYKNS